MVKQDRMARVIRRLSTSAMRGYLASGVRLHVEGMEHLPRDGGAIVVANHASALDGWLLLCTIPRMLYFFTLAQHFAHPLAAWYGRAMGALPDHGGKDRDATLAAGAAVLRDGYLLASFPEGNVNPEPAVLRPFKNGFLLLAVQLGLPVVPIAIIGSQRMLRDPVRPRGLRAFRLQPAEIRICVMEPMVFHCPPDERELFAQQREQVRQVIADRISLHTAL